MQEKVEYMLNGWKDKLLDTGKRNQLINFKGHSASTIRIIHPPINDFVGLVGRKNISFNNIFEKALKVDEFSDEEETQQKVVNINGVVLPYKERYQPHEILDIIKQSESNKNNIYTNLNYLKERKNLRNLRNKAKLFKEETAIDILHIAIGFLIWFESVDSNIEIKSPLVLVPIKLEQESFDSPFKLNLEEGDFLINDSLVKKLKGEYGLDINFNLDVNNDMQSELSKYYEFVLSKSHDSRWSIEESIEIGLFSFSKINMVKDLEENTNEILENELVAALSGEYVEHLNEPINMTDEDLNQRMTVNNLFQVYDADSSQEIAIQSAIDGKSFVLQGPPGTGKSQTITNVISELLARNKKILFVAEKKAALDVVFSNLQKVSLHNFALPLHNNKINKKDFIKDLSDELNRRQNNYVVNQSDLEELNSSYENSKYKLTEYANALTKIQDPFNKSLYQLYGLYLKLEKYQTLQFDAESLINDSIDANSLNEIISNFEQAYDDLNKKREESIWWGVEKDSVSLLEQDKIKSDISQINHLLSVFKNQFLIFEDYLNLNNQFPLEQAIKAYNELYDLIFGLPEIPEEFMQINSFDQELNLLEEYKELISKINQTQKNLKNYLDDTAVESIEMHHIENVINNGSLFKRLTNGKYKTSKKLIELYISRKIKSNELFEIAVDLKKLNDLTTNKNQTQEKFQINYTSFSEPDINQNIMIFTWLNDLKSIIKSYGIPFDAKWDQNFLTWLKSVQNKTQNFRLENPTYESFNSKIDIFFNDYRVHVLNDYNLLSLNVLKDIFEKLIGQFDELNRYLRFNYYYQKGVNIGLSQFFSEATNQDIKSNLLNVFKKRYYRTAIDIVLKKYPELQFFTSQVFDDLKSKFVHADKEQINIARYRIEELLIQQTPVINGVEGFNSEVITLRREAEKSRKIKSVRQLFIDIPNLILTLKPCVMMSPLSVSTYLGKDSFKFDTVIFDEASQIKPESAIGAIYRGKQVIIVGDKKQLPPTNFFNNTDNEEYEDENFDNFDSILEIADTAFQSIPLRWHYRSKYEELINVSNKEIYQNLITFPSDKKPNPSDNEGITFEYVKNAVYQRGQKSENKSGTNPIEADRVVELIYKHFKKFGSRRSLGVVTFNAVQQQEILNNLLKFRRENDIFKDLFSEDIDEPFFIKNIETVQGDERDTIILNTTYGKDRFGKLNMNFGAINSVTGYRRLNVAITRARENVILVTSLKGSDIRVDGVNTRGLKLLQTYLNYAELGEDLKVDSVNEYAESDSPFEEDVYEAIIDMGFQAKKQVGSSGFKIDIGILHPTNPVEFILGIECDGATYHSAKSARDRDRLRQEILETRGWDIHRIWSTDWFLNKASEINRLKDKIEDKINHKKPLPKLNEAAPKINVEITEQKRNSKFPEFDVYPGKEALITGAKTSYDYSELEFIFQETAPIHIDTIKKIVPALYGKQKFTNVVDRDYHNDYRTEQLRLLINYKNDIYFMRDKIISFRRHGKYSLHRLFKNIAVEELSVAYHEFLKIAEQVDVLTLRKNILELTGYKSMSKEMEFHFEKSIQHYVKHYEVTEKNGVILLDSNELN